MSASEKLKALNETMHPAPWRAAKGNELQSPMILQADVIPFDSTASAPGMADLRNALPQIVATVEAAETMRDRLDCPGYIKEALAALDEALA